MDDVDRILEVAAAALMEVGFEARPGTTSDGIPVLWHLSAEPPCDVTYKAFKIAAETCGRTYIGFDEWHGKQNNRIHCSCRRPARVGRALANDRKTP